MIRSEEFRYKMMRRGVEYGEIFASAAGTIRMSGSGEIKQSLQANFFPYAVDSRGNRTEINWISDEIKPYLVIDGQEYPLGVFLPAAVTPTTNKGQSPDVGFCPLNVKGINLSPKRLLVFPYASQYAADQSGYVSDVDNSVIVAVINGGVLSL